MQRERRPTLSKYQSELSQAVLKHSTSRGTTPCVPLHVESSAFLTLIFKKTPIRFLHNYEYRNRTKQLRHVAAQSKVRSLAANGLGLGCDAFTATRNPEAAFADAAATLISLPGGNAFAAGAAFFEKPRFSNDVAEAAFDAGAEEAAAGGSVAAAAGVAAAGLASVRSGTVAAAVAGLAAVRSGGAAGLASGRSAAPGRRNRSIAGGGGVSRASVLSTWDGAAAAAVVVVVVVVVVVGASGGGVSAPT